MPKASEKNPGYTSTLSTNTLSLDTLEAMSEDKSKSSSMCKVLGKVMAENRPSTLQIWKEAVT